MTMTITEAISRYSIMLHEDGDKLRCARPKAQADAQWIIAHKAEIIAELRRRQEQAAAAAREHQARIDAIEGLRELQAALNAHDAYRRAFAHMMDDGQNDGIRPPAVPASSIEELRARYPRAAAYIKADAWACAEHYAKAAAGRKALERIIQGDDYAAALADMEAEWAAYCNAWA